MTSHRAAAAASAAPAAAAAVDGRRVGDKCASDVRDEPLTHTLHVVLHDCDDLLLALNHLGLHTASITLLSAKL